MHTLTRVGHLERTVRVVLLVGLCCSSGCKPFEMNWKKPKWPWQDNAKLVESDFQDPNRLAAIWTPDGVAVPGEKPTRGFGGRFFFYNERSESVPVEGQLVVYAYDESKEAGNQRTPERRFVFTPDQFSQHFSSTELGASYSVWLPWDDVGSEQKSISLVPVFTSANGKIVMGQQSLNVLPGRTPEPEPETISKSDANGSVKPAVHEELAASEETQTATSTGRASLQPTTITIPRTLRQRMLSVGEKHARDQLPNQGQWVSSSSANPTSAVAHANIEQPIEPQAAPSTPRRPTHFERPRFPAPRVPDWRSGRAPVGSVPNLAERPSFHPYSQILPQGSPAPVSASAGVENWH